VTVTDALAWLTLALLFVTGYYAWQTRRTVEEMRSARTQAVQPKLAINIDWMTFAPAMPMVELRNVGLGPALHLDVLITFEPRGEAMGDSDRPWTTNVLMPGEAHLFFSPNVAGQPLDNERFVAAVRAVRLTGSVQDALGNELHIDEAVENLKDMWEMEQTASRRIPRSPQERMASSLNEIANALRSPRSSGSDQIFRSRPRAMPDSDDQG